MQKFKQLNLAQRYQIEALLKSGQSQSAIALLLNVHRSTISRELSRNIASRGRTAREYVAKNAQRKTSFRHQQKAKQVKLTSELKLQISSYLRYNKWSPELISQWLKKQNQPTVSHETIYLWIWKAKKSRHLNYKGYNILCLPTC